MSLLSQQPEFYKKKIWPLDLSKQYAEDVRNIAFENRYRIVDSTKITSSFKSVIDNRFEQGLCAGFVAKEDLPVVTVVPPRHCKFKKESKEDLLLKSMSDTQALRSEIEELKRAIADKPKKGRPAKIEDEEIE